MPPSEPKKANIRGLYAIVDSGVSQGGDLIQLAHDYLIGGVKIIQLRDKRRLESPELRAAFLKVAQEIADRKCEFDFTFIVNDDLETAVEVEADGIHVGGDDFSIEECRKVLGPSKQIGYSSHSLKEAVEAQRREADYVAFGAIYPTATKGPGHPIQGIEKLREVVQSVSIPVVAIGGIGRHNLQEVLSTGVASVAMISALAKAGDRVEEAKYFNQLMARSSRLAVG